MKCKRKNWLILNTARDRAVCIQATENNKEIMHGNTLWPFISQSI